MTKGKLILTRGLPASGKSTWAKEIASASKDNVRISPDDIRLMRGKYWIPQDEPWVWGVVRHMAIEAIKDGKTAIIDAMNLNEELTNKLIDDISEATDIGMVQFKNFYSSTPEQLMKRAMERIESGDLRNISLDTMMQLIAKYPHATYQPRVDYPRDCVIVDIDGTIAKMEGRSPYDWDRVGEDKPIPEVIDLVRMFHEKDYKIIFMSGRDAKCMTRTIEWLNEHVTFTKIGFGFSDCRLFMRPQGNTQKDSAVKFMLYHQNVAKEYDVKYVIDDRNQVVDMWRNVLGFRTLQVADGNF